LGWESFYVERLEDLEAALNSAREASGPAFVAPINGLHCVWALWHQKRCVKSIL
jgi:hypothetical protein